MGREQIERPREGEMNKPGANRSTIFIEKFGGDVGEQLRKLSKPSSSGFASPTVDIVCSVSPATTTRHAGSRLPVIFPSLRYQGDDVEG